MQSLALQDSSLMSRPDFPVLSGFENGVSVIFYRFSGKPFSSGVQNLSQKRFTCGLEEK
jgi:hypothetical protein